jgi:ADP-heptose:LPS heptosyltransferase
MSLNPEPSRRKATFRDVYRQGRSSLLQAWRPVRNRISFLAPYRKAEIHILRGGALGDVLMATPALRRVKELNPSCRVIFYTHFASLVRGLPFIDEVRPVDAAPTWRSIRLRYENLVPVRRHIAGIFGEILGVDIRNNRPSCVLDPRLLEHYRHEFRDLPRPWIILNRRAGPWSPNKNWPDSHWQELIGRLLRWATVIETGTGVVVERPGEAGHYVNLVDKLSQEALAAATAAADLHVGPDSGPMHLAAAFDVPAVVIFGGYIEPSCTSYPGNIDLYSPVPCAPCWLTELCPFGRPCLHQITPQQVEVALKQLWEHKNQPGKRGPLAPTGDHDTAFSISHGGAGT